MLDTILGLLPTENPLMMTAIGIIALLLVISLIKSLFKMAFILLIIGVVAVVGFGMTPDEVLNKGKELASYGTDFVNEKVKPAVLEGIKQTVVTKNEDGTTTLKNEELLIEKNKDNETTITVKSLNVSFTLDELAKYLTAQEMEQLKAFINQNK